MRFSIAQKAVELVKAKAQGDVEQTNVTTVFVRETI